MRQVGNLFTHLPERSPDEHFLDLVSKPGLRIERIVSTGQATPVGEWLDQSAHEWVALLSGTAAISLEGSEKPRVLLPGDWLLIPAHTRHRVEWTDANAPTIWLAVHYGDGFDQ